MSLPVPLGDRHDGVHQRRRSLHRRRLGPGGRLVRYVILGDAQVQRGCGVPNVPTSTCASVNHERHVDGQVCLANSTIGDRPPSVPATSPCTDPRCRSTSSAAAPPAIVRGCDATGRRATTTTVARNAAVRGHRQQRAPTSRDGIDADHRSRRPSGPPLAVTDTTATRPAPSASRSPASPRPRPAAPRRTPGPPPALPPGVTVAANGAVTGTPTTAGTYNVDIDGHRLGRADRRRRTPRPSPSRSTPRPSASRRSPTSRAPVRPRPLDGQIVNTEGVVTARYPTGGLNGFYIQTPGADTAERLRRDLRLRRPGGFTTYPADRRLGRA